MWQTVLAIVIVLLVIAVFFITYILNKRTPIPDECKNSYDAARCDGCTLTSCALSKIKEIKEEEKEEGK